MTTRSFTTTTRTTIMMPFICLSSSWFFLLTFYYGCCFFAVSPAVGGVHAFSSIMTTRSTARRISTTTRTRTSTSSSTPFTTFTVEPFLHTSSTSSLYSSSSSSQPPFRVSGMWNNGLSYGKGPFRFYKNFDSWMSPFPPQDREMYPEIFAFPRGVYEVSLVKPLGIIFEEIEVGKGVYVVDLVEGGNAQQMGGTIQKGDVLVGVTAVKVVGAKWERRLIPAKDLSFDTVVGAIGSNDEKWGCDDVVLWFMRPEEVEDVQMVEDFLAFFNPPGDSAWRTA